MPTTPQTLGSVVSFRVVSFHMVSICLALGLLVALEASASAQSGTRGRSSRGEYGNTTIDNRGAGGMNAGGSGTRMSTPVAMNGYCPVCIIEMHEWVKGTPNQRAVYDDHTYYFPGAEQKQMFLADPMKYVPAMGGDCVVCSQNMGERVAGSVYHAAFYHDRLYLFPGKEQKEAFAANPGNFADADLALGGQCSVCQVEMGKAVAGSPEFATMHNGLRYFFPGAEHLEMFVADPAKYAVESASP